MKVLGLSGLYHDASAALADDGVLVAAGAEERFSRRKHDARLPLLSAQSCLAAAGIQARELDALVFYEEPSLKFTRVLTETLAGFPGTGGRFVRSMHDWLTRRLWTVGELSKRLDLHPDRIRLVPHHLSHAGQAFLGSPFDTAAVLTVDAVGEWSSTGLARGDRAHPDGVQILETFDYPHSLGLLYAAFTAFLGFRPNDGECSTMALAGFGQPTRVDDIRRILRLHDDGSYQVTPGWFDLTSPDRPFTDRFLSTFGQPRDPAAPLPVDAMVDGPAVGGAALPADVQPWLDLAASLQVVLEDALLGLARRLHAATGESRLCVAGGVALNCVAMRRLAEEGPFEQLFIPADPGDGGASAGAALVGSRQLGATGRGLFHPYLGEAHDPGDLAAFLDQLPAGRLAPALSGDGGAPRLELLSLSPDDVIARTVDELRAGRVVGWFQGRFEVGPRALGARSILVEPDRVALATRVSREVKFRAPFRPYALSIAEEDARRVLLLPDAMPLTAHWMQSVATVRDAARPDLRAAMHADGTTRPQVCRAAENPRYHALLRAHAQARGVPGLLNTSFNERGYPIVRTPMEALVMFARTGMDSLVLGDTMLRKVG